MKLETNSKEKNKGNEEAVMEPEDPFGWITKLCKGAFSEDSSMRSCSYFGQLDSDISGPDSGRKYPSDIPVASTDITMVSLDTDGDTVSGDTVSVQAGGSESRRVVDLGSDTDLVFSEREVPVDTMQRSEAYSTPKESEPMLVSKRGVSLKRQSSTKPPSKKLKSLGFESPSVHLGDVQRSADKQTGSELELEGQKNHESKAEVGEGSIGGKRVDFSTEVMECDWPNDNGEGNSCGNGKSVEDGGGNGSNTGGNQMQDERKRELPAWARRQCDGPKDNGEGNSGGNEKSAVDGGGNGSNMGGNEMQEKTRRLRELPAWLRHVLPARVRVEPVEAESDSESMSEESEEITDVELDGESEDVEETTLMDVLLDLEKNREVNHEEEASLHCLSLLEVAQRKWGEDFMSK